MVGSEIAVLVSDILELAGSRVEDLDIASQVLLTPHLAEIGISVVCAKLW